MSFFQSELVRGDIQEMMELQQFCFRSAMNFVLLDNDRKMDYFEKLELLIEKQKTFYFRIKLSDDPEAVSVLELSLIHISEPTRRYAISYAVFCLKKKMSYIRTI